MHYESASNDGGGASGNGRRLGGGAIATLGGVAVLLIFMIQNRDRVEVQFLWWGFSWPTWLLTLVSAVVGALVWFGLGVVRRRSRRKARREDR